MTKAEFLFHGDMIVAFEISGHSGYAQEGADIVCSAISSAVYMTANTISEIMSLPVEAEVQDGYINIRLDIDTARKAKVLTDGLYLHITELGKQYPHYLKIERGVFNA